MHKRIALNGLAAFGLMFGAAAHADFMPGFYVGASVGQSSIEISDVDFDATDTAFKLFGGYTFNQYFGVEVAYLDGGAPDERYDFGLGTGSVEVEMTGFNASAVGRLPLSDMFTLFGKIGFASYDVEASARVNGVVVESLEGSDEDVSYGLGADFAFGRFSLRAEYEMIDAEGADVSLLTVGGVFRF